jgi:phosphoglycolate phosphatase-like HAD superfamily hydrolase/DNA-binding transcriptional ArsR family regulator
VLSGQEALDAVIDRLALRAAQGEQVAILWDMDGTLVDTRLRMLAAVHAFGRTDVQLGQVSPSWQETAARLGIDPERFRAVWLRVFWAYESFDADSENETVARRARRAESLGIQSIIVTGRIEELRPVTDRQLERLQLKPSRVFLKATTGDCTPAVKAEVISKLAREGLHLGAFVTDSHEEINAALASEVLRHAPDLACIFVELEGTSPSLLPSGAHHFPVVPEDLLPPRREPGRLQVAGDVMTFGFEAEYEIETADALLLLYDPDASAGITTAQWRFWSQQQRIDWVNSYFPDPHSEEFDLPLIRNARHPELDFLQPQLFVDSDGNLEIVSPPTDSLDKLWNQIEQLEEICGPAQLQATVSIPGAGIYDGPGLDGFLSFHHLLDTFERMAVGHAIVRENPEREALLPFLHPWLGPMTHGKHRFMRMYLEANAKGDWLDEKWVRLVDRAFSSFKYINSSAYRPALAGRDRLAIEIRDAHRNKALLAQRLQRNAICLLGGFEPYASFAQTWGFDSEADYDRLPAAIRQMLESVIPTRVRPEIDFMYSDYDRIALQVYRHFSLPLKDYSDVEIALGDPPGNAQLLAAQRAYFDKLAALADGWESVGAERTRREVQAALAAFSNESGLLERLEEFSRKSLTLEDARAAQAQIQPHLPLLNSIPRSAWVGCLKKRLERLQRRWPNQVRLYPSALLGNRQGEVQHDLVVLSSHGLTTEERARQLSDYVDALAHHTLSLRATDRGGLELRLGGQQFVTSAPALEAGPYHERTGLFEPTLVLSPLEALALRRQLAAHHPCEYAARRVSASGWLRHLPIGLTALETCLELPYPASIETAAQVVDRVLATSQKERIGCVTHWISEPLSEFSLDANQKLTLAPTHIASGFPPDRFLDGPLEERLQGFVGRWPQHSRLVDGVPFVFGKGSQQRQVLVLAMAGLDDESAERFQTDLISTIGADTVSFPLRYRAEHLRTRIGILAFALSAEGVRVDEYEGPWRRRRLETMLTLSAEEMLKLRRAVGAVIENTLETLGPITLEAGCRRTQGHLDNNRPADGGLHNCTTWITLAPIGDGGEDLATLAQMPAHWESHDNPGWWSMFLTGASRSDRAKTVLYWSDLPLDQEPCAPGLPIEWDYNLR